jgi:D-beta-D-heptose 7-phosphate kinase / D-beta-D-heptose 1-phosphate adenosyltransferase
MILKQNQLAEWRNEQKTAARTVCATGGCFDLLHRGHLHLLQKCRLLEDVVIVGLNTDESVRILKGESRPIVLWEERAAHLLALKYVDVVVPITDTMDLLGAVWPDTWVKGEEYRDHLAHKLDHAFVEGYGGRVVLVDRKFEQSTTDRLSAIRGKR